MTLLRTSLTRLPRKSVTKKPGSRPGSSNPIFLIKSEVHFYVNLHGYWLTIFAGGFKLPGSHGFHRLLVQAKSQRTLYADVSGTAIRSHHHPQHHSSLIFPFARFFRIIRTRRKQDARRRNSTTYTIRPPTNTAAPSRTNSRTASRTNATTAT